MVFDSIKRNVFAIITMCVIIVSILWGTNFIGSSDSNVANTVASKNTMPLQQLIGNYLYAQHWIAIASGALLTLLLGMLLYRLNELHLFITKREQLLPIVFTLLVSAFLPANYIQGVHFALFFTILSLNNIFATYRRDYAFREIFMASVYLSTATLFYAPSAYYLIILVISINLMKPLLWRDVVVVLSGISVPYVFALFYYFFTAGDWQIPFTLLSDNILVAFPLSFPELDTKQWIYIIYILLICLIALLRIIFIPPTGSKIKLIRINALFGWMFIMALLANALYPSAAEIDHLIFAAFPATVLVVNLFSSIKSNGRANSLFLVLLLLIAAMQLSTNFYVSIATYATNVWDFVVNLF